MLRITVHKDSSPTTLELEGRIAGDWVDELERAWLAEVGPDELIKVDLSGVTFVDEDGKKLLGRMFEEGSNLYVTDCMNRSIIEEIKRKGRPHAGNGRHRPVHSQVR